MNLKSTILFFSLPFLSVLLLTGCRNNELSQKKVISCFYKGDQESSIFSVTVNNTKVPVTVVPNVDTAEAVHIAEQYKKLPKYCWIDSRYITAHYIHFASDTSVRLVIRVNEPVHTFTIYPKRTHILATVQDSTLTCTLNRNLSKYYLFSINKLPMFVVMMEDYAKERPAPDKSISLKDLVRKPVSDYTDIFRQALDSINGTGKTLVIPAGEYLTEEIRISHGHDFNIYMEPGSLIKIKTSPPGKNVPSAGIRMEYCRNIRIYGNGCLDHQAYENFRDGRNDYHYGFPGYDFYFRFENISPHSIYLQSPLMLIYSQNITIEGLLIRNGRNYNVNSRHCDNIILRNVKVITPAGCVPENTDGINIGSYHHFRVEKSFVYCNDDCFSTGHNLLPYDNRGAEDLVIEDFVGWNPRANGVRLGWACNTYLGDMLFRNCDFSGFDDCSMLLHHHTSTGHEDPDSLAYGTVRFENCSFDDVNRYTLPMIEVQHTVMKALEFNHVTFDTLPPIKARIYGDSLRHIGRLLLQDVMIGPEKVTKKNFDFDTEYIEQIIIK